MLKVKTINYAQLSSRRRRSGRQFLRLHSFIECFYTSIDNNEKCWLILTQSAVAWLVCVLQTIDVIVVYSIEKEVWWLALANTSKYRTENLWAAAAATEQYSRNSQPVPGRSESDDKGWRHRLCLLPHPRQRNVYASCHLHPLYVVYNNSQHSCSFSFKNCYFVQNTIILIVFCWIIAMSTHHYIQIQLVAYIVCEPFQYNTAIQWQQLAQNDRRWNTYYFTNLTEPYFVYWMVSFQLMLLIPCTVCFAK